jgi:hypothetical protein
VAKVIGTSKLRTKYESHEAKRSLCGAYDLFLADERILPSLPKLLGAPPPRRPGHVLPQPGVSVAPRTCLAPCSFLMLFRVGRGQLEQLLLAVKLEGWVGYACPGSPRVLCQCSACGPVGHGRARGAASGRRPPARAGKAFFRKKRQPVPVDLRGSDWGAQIKRALGATYFFHTGGSCINLRRGARSP